MSNFENKKVLITGGASGIGLLMGKRALELGASHFIIWDLNALLMKKVIAEISAEGKTALGYQVDVSDAEAVEEASKTLIQNNLIPDILILNAGIVSGKYFHTHDKGEIERTINVNVLGCMLPARAFLPAMIARGNGHIVSISSAAGMLANQKMAVYAASKWAVYGWSESLRLEMQALKTGIHVTTVTPSFINTGMFDGVKTNPIIPKLSPEKATRKIIRGIQKNKIFVRMPLMVYTLPFVKGILPVRWFDLLVGKGLGVYKTMQAFTGRKP
jgi:short-subunit dehydrogenase